jgi:hypothetical protein
MCGTGQVGSWTNPGSTNGSIKYDYFVGKKEGEKEREKRREEKKKERKRDGEKKRKKGGRKKEKVSSVPFSFTSL